ncbi:Ig-like domain-containing protein [Providencia hangzhouensis]|uniref:Ig-like domain-containing protein n=1 Tax=Providencia hangzhouensis TaxID=3031799 RepID=UPI0034DD23D4
MPVSELTIDKPVATGVVGEAISLRLSLTPANTSNQNAIWKSSDTAKATVNSTGQVTLKAAGKVTITATVDGVTVNSVITINEKANNG